ncbi:hypothetical protein ACUXI4_003338 [Pantoea piersonii]|jgi:hypothetical protein
MDVSPRTVIALNVISSVALVIGAALYLNWI